MKRLFILFILLSSDAYSVEIKEERFIRKYFVYHQILKNFDIASIQVLEESNGSLSFTYLDNTYKATYLNQTTILVTDEQSLGHVLYFKHRV